ncbi:MAG: glycosyltransferase family 39 protein [Planctomycetaceae bacterium]|nr:glycosyltransferase family 39 protein [Planctomycetaceae bacterium]
MTVSASTTRSYSLLAAVLMALLAVSAIASRPLLPVDETRYLGVAWEMHHTGDWLVPHRNGEPYSEKPPLLFWLINAVWMVTGVSEYPARMISPLAAIGCVLLTGRISRQLWPDSAETIRSAPLIHVSLFLWMFFSPLTMFDMLLTLLTLAAISCWIRSAFGKPRAWLTAGALMGLGILTKGPVILVHVLPAVLFAPWWQKSLRSGLAAWYGKIAGAILVAAAIGLAWAVPAALQGGPEFADRLLIRQTTDRVTNSFSHQQPWWWYAPILPACLLPWISVTRFWKNLRFIHRDRGCRFVLTWLAGTLVILSAVSGKQAYYLLPCLPAFALLAGRLLTTIPGDRPPELRPHDTAFLRYGGIVPAILPLVFNHVALFRDLRLAGLCPDWASIPLLAVALVLCHKRWHTTRTDIAAAIREISIVNVLFTCVLVITLRDGLWNGFRMDELAHWVHDRQEEDRSILWLTSYHDQLHFAGRLRHPLPDAVTLEDASEWLQRHPNSIMLMRFPQTAIPANFSTPVTDAQMTELTEILNQLPESHPLPPGTFRVVHASPVRRGLRKALMVAIETE